MKILSNYGKTVSPKLAREFKFISQGVITKGYVSNKGYLIETMLKKDFIAYVYTNELLAKQSFEKILNLVKPETQEGKIISQIMIDELRHHGMAEKHFLKYYPKLQPWQLMIYRVRETISNKSRKFYDKNLRLLDKVLSPLYKLMGFIAAKIACLINLNEFKRTGKNLMDISPKSII